MYTENPCTDCPRHCKVKRWEGKTGFCRMPNAFRVARVSLHPYEEPPISGEHGSGTVFFSGCSLQCVFCQNKIISHEGKGEEVTEEELARRILSLQEAGAHNINLVTPTHFVSLLVPLLEKLKPKLYVPVIYNCSGYEDEAALKRLHGLIDIYMPDFKYVSKELSAAYSAAEDYEEKASLALLEMYRQVGKVILDEKGMLQKGILLRHLVLPGCRKDSVAVLEKVASLLPPNDILLSLMRQYTPDFALDSPYPNLKRKLTTFEYTAVLQKATELGFKGFTQGKDSASPVFTPDF